MPSTSRCLEFENQDSLNRYIGKAERTDSRFTILDSRGNEIPMLRFTKMNGAGNDFVMVDNRAGDVRLTPEQIMRICDRHRGVGADGILLLELATNSADFR